MTFWEVIDMAKKIKCPTWGCDGIGIPADTKKKFSLTKCLVGNTVGLALGGSTGAIIGAAAGINGKNGKTTFVCSKCGRVFTAKL